MQLAQTDAPPSPASISTYGFVATSERPTAYGGSNLIRNASTLLELHRKANYFEERAFFELIEALVFHDTVVLFGDFDEVDCEWRDKFNRHLGPNALITRSSSEREFAEIMNSPSLQINLTTLLRAVFGDQAPALSVPLLNDRPTSSRCSGDQKEELIQTALSLSRKTELGTMFDFNGFAKYLRKEYDRSLIDSDRRFVVNNLFRTFLYAAISLERGGTALSDGIRKYIQLLIEHSSGPQPPAVLGKRLYDIADTVYQEIKRTMIEPKGAVFYLPLATEYVFSQAPDRFGILDALAETRNRFAKYRMTFHRFQSQLDSEDTTYSQKIKIRQEVIGSSAEYLRQIIEQLNFGSSSQLLGLGHKLLAKTINPILRDQSLSYDGSDGQVSFSGSLGISIIQACAQAWHEQKKENDVRELLNIVKHLIDRQGLAKHLRRITTFHEDDSAIDFDQTIHRIRLST